MYLKNIKLFCCVTFYFFQCHGAPTPQQKALIKRRVPQLLGQEDITFHEVRTVFSEVARELGINVQPSTLDELEKIEFSREEVIIYTLAFIASNERSAMQAVNGIVGRRFEQVDSMSYREDLIEILIAVGKLITPRRFFPSTVPHYIHEASQKTAYNRLFRLKEVKTFALAFLASADENLMNIVRNVMTENGNPDSMGYEEYKNVIENVKEQIGLQKPTPSYYSFQSDILSRKFTVNGIENMIIEKLFP